MYQDSRSIYALHDYRCKLTPWSRVLLVKLIVTQLVKNIPRLLRNPKFHHRIHKILPLVSILSQINPTHTFLLYFSKVNSNIILISMLRSFKRSFPFRLSDQNLLFISHLSHACYIHRQYTLRYSGHHLRRAT
jgi:hypothetical protein